MARRRTERIVALPGNIKRIREMKGWTLRDLAEKAEMWLGYVQKLETCQTSNPSIAVVAKIAKVLDVTVDDLVGDEVIGGAGEQGGTLSIDRVSSNVEHGPDAYIQMRLKLDDGRWIDATMSVEDFGMVVTGRSEIPVTARVRPMRKPKGAKNESVS